MKKFILTISLLSLFSCKVADIGTGPENSLKNIPNWTDSHFMENVVEISALENNGDVDYFYDYAFSGNLTLENSNQKIDLTDDHYRFSYIEKTSLGLLMFYSKNGDIHAKHSQNNGLTWLSVNSGNPILNNGQGYYQHLWNMAFTEDDSGNLHALVECGNNVDQSDVALCYGKITFSNITQIDFNGSMEVEPAIHGAGNPWMGFDSSTGKVLTIYGATNRVSGDFTGPYWHLRASIFDGYEWLESDSFIFGESKKHIADPHVLEKDGTMSIFYSYDQFHIYKLEREFTVSDFISEYF